jgi:hypothetical protein
MQMDMETDTETETTTDSTRTWTWNWQTFTKYFIRRNCPYSAKWNASKIAWRNIEWRYILKAPFYMKKIHTTVGIGFQMLLAELEISV